MPNQGIREDGGASSRGLFWSSYREERDGVELELVAQPAVNLALVHNAVPIVRAVRVVNDSGTPLENVGLRLEIDAGGTELVDAWQVELAEVFGPSTYRTWDAFGGFVPRVSYLSSLEESHRATITATLTYGHGAELTLRAPIQVLAHNEWYNAPPFYESLAAFVQPNTAAVADVLREAGALLQDQTGDSSLCGYQRGAERASLIAAAIYEALRAREIHYIDPPASFEDTGQKVRTTAQVLDQRLGTCIDLCVTYAACLEQAGLHPLIWLIDGHAFAGYLRDGNSLGQTVVTEPNTMVNLVESSRAVPVEAVYYRQDDDGGFLHAIERGRKLFSRLEALRGMVDVHAARRAGTRPLPSREPAPAQTSEPAAAPAPKRDALELPPDLLDRPDEDDALLAIPDDAPVRVRNWKRALLDLSTRNRLLNLRPSNQVLGLHVPTGALGHLDDLVHAGKTIRLVPNDALTDLQRLQGARRAQDLEAAVVTRFLVDDKSLFVDVTERAYVRRMRQLQRTARTLLEETGNANLYLAVGALTHKTVTGAEARAPLFLLPVKIGGGAGRSEFTFRVDATHVAAPNHCLVEWLRIKHNVRIDALATPKLDQSGIDIAAALPAIRDALVEHRLDMRIEEGAWLAICQFSTFGMWLDLERSWDVLARNPVVEHLALRPGEVYRDPSLGTDSESAEPVIDEAEMPLPIPADGSQLKAVALAAAGRSFVLEGPPGTGKSQTITNLIAHALERGKTVLFVAEKQAALDVVKRRLERIGLTDFALDLHGRSQSPAEIRAQLKRAIDKQLDYNPLRWDAACAELRQRHLPLAEYPRLVHEPNEAGMSLWSAHETLHQCGPGPVAPVPVDHLAVARDCRGPITEALRRFARSARTVGLRARHPWAIVGTIDDRQNEAATVAEAARELETARHALLNDQGLRAVLEGVADPRELETVSSAFAEWVTEPFPSTRLLEQVRTPSWQARSQRICDDVERLRDQHASVLTRFTASFLEHGEVADLRAAATEARRGLLGRRRRAEAFQATVRPLVLDDVTIDPAEVDGLAIGVEAARRHAEQLRDEARDLLGDALPPQWSPLHDDAIAVLGDALQRLRSAERFERAYGPLWRSLEHAGRPREEAVSSLDQAVGAWRTWLGLLNSGDEELTRWAGGRHWVRAWDEDGPVWAQQAADSGATAARRWAAMVDCLRPLLDGGLHQFRADLLDTTLDANEAEMAYLRGVASASARERREATGLVTFDPAVRDGEITDFASAAEQTRKEQKLSLPDRLLRRRRFRADRLEGRVAELRRRLDAKRGGMSFRQLVERYGQEIVEAAPCFFVSPASLAQFVPPGAITFDIVVFDEASQVTVAQAIGALGRGRSAVIVGDSQQMPPTSFGVVKADEARSDPDDEPDVVDDLDSILTECVESGLPRVWLSWHYRSQDETLIAFSNSRYYEDRLASLPTPGGAGDTGIELRRVQGHFNREDRGRELRTNRIEAEAIVEEIRARLANPRTASESIGVVTFNAQQRDLILNLLEESDDPLIARQLREEADEGLFVKNLENVQGDERDTILFSIAFSRRPDGGPLPLNFGPLSGPGGEKRLNVAVTRARRKVVLFASFDPADIDLSRTSSRGLADLRAYLELAAYGPETLPRRAVAGDEGDRIRDAIAEALRERGYEVACDYGLSDFSVDLAVKRPDSERWQIAIVLDGPRWARRDSVVDRDLTPLLLESMMGWSASMRLWLPEWIADPEAALRRVDAAIAAAEELDEEREAAGERQTNEQRFDVGRSVSEEPVDPSSATGRDGGEADDDEPTVEVETYVPAVDGPLAGGASPVNGGSTETSVTAPHEPAATPTTSATEVVARAHDGVKHAASVEGLASAPPEEPRRSVRETEYRTCELESLGTPDDLSEPLAPVVQHRLVRAIRTLVDVEGPIVEDRLARTISRGFGLARTSAARRKTILEAVPKELVRTYQLGTFVWPSTIDPGAWRGYRRTPPGCVRPLTEIPPEELVNAMAAIASSEDVTSDDALFRRTLAVFDQRRLTRVARERLRACLLMAEQAGRLVRTETGAWRSV